METHYTTNNGLRVRNDYKLASCWSMAMLLNYHHDGIDGSVSKLPWMVWNDNKLSRLVQNDVSLLLDHLTSHERSKWSLSGSPFLFNGWTTEYLVDWPAHSSYRELETIFWYTIPCTHAKFQRLHSTDCTRWFERMRHLGPSTGVMLSCTAGCYDPPTRRPTLHTQLSTVYCAVR